MTNDEKPFRPSDELDVEWLTERPANLEPIQFPIELDGMAKYLTGLRELLLSELILDNPFGVYVPLSFTPPPTEPTTPELKDLNLDDK